MVGGGWFGFYFVVGCVDVVVVVWFGMDVWWLDLVGVGYVGLVWFGMVFLLCWLEGCVGWYW